MGSRGGPQRAVLLWAALCVDEGAAMSSVDEGAAMSSVDEGAGMSIVMRGDARGWGANICEHAGKHRREERAWYHIFARGLCGRVG